MRLLAIILCKLGRSPAPARPSLEELQAAQDRALAARRDDRTAHQERARKGVATRRPKRLDAISNKMATFR